MPDRRHSARRALLHKPPARIVYDSGLWPPPWEVPTVAPGVRAITHADADGHWLLFVVSNTPGFGAGGHYLDTLPRDVRVIVPTVFSEVLAGMLLRRGFVHHPHIVWLPKRKEWLSGFYREPYG